MSEEMKDLKDVLDAAAEDFKNPIDMILDPECEDNITLYDENNNATEFEQVAVIPLDEKVYVILKPVTKIAGVADDEALVFVIEEIEDEDALVIADNEEIIDRVFDEYYKLLEEYNDGEDEE